jgi:hypothetical protein
LESGAGHGVSGIAFIVVLLSLTAFWYGGRPFLSAAFYARHGILHVPALVLGALGLWVGGLLALAAGTLTREPPAMPDRTAIMGWTVVVFAAVLAIVVMRRPDVEERLPEKTRRALDGRYVALGAVIAVAVLFAFRFL